MRRSPNLATTWVIIERVDFRWEQGFIDKDSYFEKRKELAREIDALRPIDYDDLLEAADLIRNFRVYWDQCESLENPDEARQQLIRKIVARVFVKGHDVIGIVLYGDFSIFVEGDASSREISQALKENLRAQSGTEVHSRNGSDGDRTLACIRPLVFIAHAVTPQGLEVIRAA